MSSALAAQGASRAAASMAANNRHITMSSICARRLDLKGFNAALNRCLAIWHMASERKPLWANLTRSKLWRRTHVQGVRFSTRVTVTWSLVSGHRRGSIPAEGDCRTWSGHRIAPRDERQYDGRISD